MMDGDVREAYTTNLALLIMTHRLAMETIVNANGMSQSEFSDQKDSVLAL